MCGIAGIRHFDGKPVDHEAINAMMATLEHRGPDGHGSWFDTGIGFGHRRLSIIDVAGSPQPMTSVGDRLCICFNGEIFNYRELRTELDYPFRTDGDTETVLASFAAKGIDGLRDVRGQFAYAIYDTETRELWLVRDRLGVLPLYYFEGDNMFAFASEVKALLPVLPDGPALDETQLPDYLMRRAVSGSRTLFRGIRSVPPGHYVRVRADGTVDVQAYWQPPAPAEALQISDHEAIELVSTQLTEAVRDALVADVPVGSYLSGGVDSSLIVALASAQIAPSALETFSAGFGDVRYDETAYARQVSELFGTKHHEVQVRASDFQQLWSTLTWHRDAPVSEPADIAVFRLAETARERVKVVLSGEGSDELFGGYPKYRYARATTLAGVVPSALRRAALIPLERGLRPGANRARIALRAQTAATAGERLSSWFAPFTAYECQQLLGISAPVHPDPPSRDAIDLMGRLDLASWLPDNLLERGDRMSMAASLELRPPFLDHRLVETAFRLPSRMKVRGHETKWILKQVAARHLPSSIVRRPKVGFRVPLDDWFRTGLRELAHDLLLAPTSFVGRHLDNGAVRRLIESHETARRNEEIRIWTLLSLEVWAQTFHM